MTSLAVNTLTNGVLGGGSKSGADIDVPTNGTTNAKGQLLLEDKRAGQLALPDKGTGDYVDLTDFRKDHILNNHKAGVGKPSKTEFPVDWSDEKILHNVSDIATDPNATTGVGKWDSPYAVGTREGIEIRVDFYPSGHPTHAGKISTAYPTNTTPNPPK